MTHLLVLRFHQSNALDRTQQVRGRHAHSAKTRRWLLGLSSQLSRFAFMTVFFGLTAPRHALGFTLPRDRTHHTLQTARTRRHRTKQRRQPLQRLSCPCFLVVETVFSHTTLRPAPRVPDFHVSSMKHTILAFTLAIASLLSPGCATVGGGSTRSLGHTYQDSRGLTFISLFDTGSDARGTTRTIGDGSAPRSLTISNGEFEALWNQLDESKLSRYVTQSDSDSFNAQDNFVIIKGTMPHGTSTYVIPKSEAPSNVRSWVKSFRSKTKS